MKVSFKTLCVDIRAMRSGDARVRPRRKANTSVDGFETTLEARRAIDGRLGNDEMMVVGARRTAGRGGDVEREYWESRVVERVSARSRAAGDARVIANGD